MADTRKGCISNPRGLGIRPPQDEAQIADEVGWISALLTLGAAAGAAPSGMLADRLGRRQCIIASALIFSVGATLQVYLYYTTTTTLFRYYTTTLKHTVLLHYTMMSSRVHSSSVLQRSWRSLQFFCNILTILYDYASILFLLPYCNCTIPY